MTSSPGSPSTDRHHRYLARPATLGVPCMSAGRAARARQGRSDIGPPDREHKHSRFGNESTSCPAVGKSASRGPVTPDPRNGASAGVSAAASARISVDASTTDAASKAPAPERSHSRIVPPRADRTPDRNHGADFKCPTLRDRCQWSTWLLDAAPGTSNHGAAGSIDTSSKRWALSSSALVGLVPTHAHAAMSASYRRLSGIGFCSADARSSSWRTSAGSASLAT